MKGWMWRDGCEGVGGKGSDCVPNLVLRAVRAHACQLCPLIHGFAWPYA